jgi:hypothetical protein
VEKDALTPDTHSIRLDDGFQGPGDVKNALEFQFVTSLWFLIEKTQHLVVSEVTSKTSMFITCSYAFSLDSHFAYRP